MIILIWYRAQSVSTDLSLYGQASVSELNTKVASARSAGGNDDVLRQLFNSLPGNTGGQLSREMNDVQNIRAGPGGMDPDSMTPQQLHDTLWKVGISDQFLAFRRLLIDLPFLQVLSFRDNVSKTIENTLERIPGLVSVALPKRLVIVQRS